MDGLGFRAAGGIGVLGEAFPIATAYAFESVLKAVGEVGSISAFKAVDDFPRVCAAAGVLICSDNLGRFGGEELGTWRDIVGAVCVRSGTSIVVGILMGTSVWRGCPGASKGYSNGSLNMKSRQMLWTDFPMQIDCRLAEMRAKRPKASYV